MRNPFVVSAIAAATRVVQTYPRGALAVHGTATMREIVEAMMRSDRESERAIVDRSGLTGTFDIRLWWVPVRNGGIVPDPADVMMLVTAVQQQLGLKVEPRAFSSIAIGTGCIPSRSAMSTSSVAAS